MTEAAGVWSEQNTSPSKIDAALRHLLEEQHAQSDAYAPARVLNMVAIVDREWRGEIVNRLERVGRFHPSRTIVCAIEPGRGHLDAWATMSCDAEPEAGSLAVCEERVEVELGEKHLDGLATIVDPLIVPDLATMVWSPHGHPEAVDALAGLADVYLLDSVEAADSASAIARAKQLLENGYVVDLAWLRSTPWRERIAATFDPGAWRSSLDQIDSVTVRHHPESEVSGLLFLGWLASRLDWDPGALVRQNGSMLSRAKARRREVRLQLEAEERQNVPGLAGITIGTSGGMSLSLDRGPGGLSAKRRTRDGSESSWVVLGASRGEAGILGEGIRQALLRDPTYGPALNAAAAMAA
ncbi:MAG TPA: glucose-6-phosphate dehydrogenase assembly protein OpcA [Thermoleophilaceae bacterium]|jgi:glucose-6-phosphate dehydrogenase assembly protein OpcA